jgi:putative transcription factor
MGCDLCGANGQLYRAKVEGTTLTVCDTCKEHGEHVERLPNQTELKQQAKQQRYRSAAHQPENHVHAPSGEVILIVKEGFGSAIKHAREQLGLKQEQLAQRLRIKESQLTKYETGAKKPDLETARLLEKSLRITLVEQHVEQGKSVKTESSGPLTIGDMLKKG